MPWNNGYEKKKFEEEQKKLAEQYRQAGMSEDDIREMYIYDLAEFNNNRRYFEHSEQIPDAPFQRNPEEFTPLLNKFFEEMSVTSESSSVHSRYWWIEEISDPVLAAKLKKLPPESIELLTMLMCDGLTQSEIATIIGISQVAVYKRIERLKKFLK